MPNNRPARPSLYVFAIGVAVIAATIRAAMVGSWNAADAGWVVFAFCISFGTSLVAGWGVLTAPVAVAEMWADFHAEKERGSRHKWAHTHPAAQVAGGATVDNATDEHRAAWRAWWIAVFVYAAQHGGVVSWKDKDGNGLDGLLTKYEHWRNHIITPFTGGAFKWLEPAYQGGKTKLREGVTIWFVVGELTKGNLPPAPFDEPPSLKSDGVETPINTDETLEKEL